MLSVEHVWISTPSSFIVTRNSKFLVLTVTIAVVEPRVVNSQARP